MSALQVETDATNTHMLLGGLLLAVQDSAIYEETNNVQLDMRQTSPALSDTNLLSSGMHHKTFVTVTSFSPKIIS